MKEKFLIKRNDLLQKLANFIVIRIEKARTLKEIEIWFNIGMNINAKLIGKNIYLI